MPSFECSRCILLRWIRWYDPCFRWAFRCSWKVNNRQPMYAWSLKHVRCWKLERLFSSPIGISIIGHWHYLRVWWYLTPELNVHTNNTLWYMTVQTGTTWGHFFEWELVPPPYYRYERIPRGSRIAVRRRTSYLTAPRYCAPHRNKQPCCWIKYCHHAPLMCPGSDFTSCAARCRSKCNANTTASLRRPGHTKDLRFQSQPGPFEVYNYMNHMHLPIWKNWRY